MTDHPVRWGLIGPGSIANSFATGLRAVPGASLNAVASRDRDRAAAFAARYGAATAYGNVEDLAADPAVDAIYIATPHPHHAAVARICLAAGKAVLCEKPITMNAGELVELIELAKARRVFLMEAMWTRFLPIMGRVRAWLAEGAIGEPRLVQADFGCRNGWDPAGRWLNPALGGGALLDVGIYVLAFGYQVFGAQPERIAGFAHLGATGVDEQAAMMLRWSGGRLASLTCAVRTNTPHVARINGTDGSIVIPDFWHATSATLTTSAGRSEAVTLPFAANGYEYEAIEVGRCLAAGLVESPVMGWDESLSIQRSMDELRRQWGLVYPGER